MVICYLTDADRGAWKADDFLPPADSAFTADM